MSLLVAGLTTYLLDRILSLDEMSPGALNLWLSGNKHLQQRIASGLTHIEFQAYTAGVFKIPEFIADLRALRHLQLIHPRFNKLLDLARAQRVLRRLSSTDLRRIKFDFEFDVFLFMDVSLPGSPSEPSSSTQWTLGKAFPLLETLETRMWPLSSIIRPSNTEPSWTSFSDMPANLTHLTIAFPSNIADNLAFIQALPRNLLSLTATNKTNFPEHWQHLPPHLTELKFPQGGPQTTPEHIASLPRSLTETERVFNKFDFRTSFLSSMPPATTKLEVSHIADELGKIIVDNVPVDLGSHFPRLVELSSMQMSGWPWPANILKSLPPTVRSMSLTMNYNDFTPSIWPISLTELTIHHCVGSPQKPFTRADCFPNTLKSLRWEVNLSFFAVSAIPHLPKSLTLIDLLCDEELPSNTIEFPPHLTSLQLCPGMPGGVYDPSLTWVNVEHPDIWIPESEYEDEREEICNVSNFEHLAWMDFPVKVTSCFPFEVLSSLITEIRIGFCSLPASKIKFLPRTLKSLRIRGIFYDTDFDPYSPIERAAMIEIHEIGYRLGFGDEAPRFDLNGGDPLNGDDSSVAHPPVHPISLLPRTLTHLNFAATAMTDTALEWAPLLPPRLTSLHFLGGHLPAEFLLVAPLKHLVDLTFTLDRQLEPGETLPGPNKKCKKSIIPK